VATGLVLTVNVAVVAPAATVTSDGTVATVVLLLDSETTAPPLGAGALRVTVPLDEFPPITLVGLTLSALTEGGVTVRDAVRVTPSCEPEMVTEVEVPTGLVLTVNVAVVAPLATVTLAATVATAVLLLDSDTRAPPLGAGPLRVTVPVDDVPPITLVGLTPSEDSVVGGGVTVSDAVRVAPLYPAEIVTDVEVDTVLVLTVNVTLVAPLATVTLDGTVATAALLLESETRAPPPGAGALRVTVPVDEFPPVTLVGETLTEDRVAGGGVTVSDVVRVTPL
jgi:hypothetical protein